MTKNGKSSGTWRKTRGAEESTKKEDGNECEEEIGTRCVIHIQIHLYVLLVLIILIRIKT